MTEITEWSLKVVSGEEIIRLKDRNKVYTCGRLFENDIICKNESISKRHCAFHQRDGNLFIEDLGSVNGVYINGKRLEVKQMQLQEGDIIKLPTKDVEPVLRVNKFVYRVEKQVFIDLEEEQIIKLEQLDSSIEIKENDDLANNMIGKLSKMTEKETVPEARERITEEALDNNNMKVTPSVTIEDSANQTMINMNIQFHIEGNKGVVPNIFINQLGNRLNIALDSSIERDKQENDVKNEMEETAGITDPEVSVKVATSPVLDKSINQENEAQGTGDIIMISDDDTESPVTTPSSRRKIIINENTIDSEGTKAYDKPVNSRDQRSDIIRTGDSSSTIRKENVNAPEEEIAIIDLCEEVGSLENGDLTEFNESFQSQIVSETLLKPLASSAVKPTNYNHVPERTLERIQKNSIKLDESENRNSSTDIEITEESKKSRKEKDKKKKKKKEKSQHKKRNGAKIVENAEDKKYKEKEVKKEEIKSVQEIEIISEKEMQCNKPKRTDDGNSKKDRKLVDYTDSDNSVDLTTQHEPVEQSKLKNTGQNLTLTPEQILIKRTLDGLVSWKDNHEPTKNPRKRFISTQCEEKEQSKKFRRSSIDSSRSDGPYPQNRNKNGDLPHSFRRSPPSSRISSPSSSHSSLNSRVSPYRYKKFSSHIIKATSKFGEFCQRIVSWDPKAFGDWASDGCVIKKYELKETLLCYENFEHYSETFTPLILLAIACAIKNAYVTIERTPTFSDCRILDESLERVFINQEFANMLKFQIKIYSTKKTRKLPKIGDLLRLDMVEKGNLTEIFAYVMFHSTYKRTTDGVFQEDISQEVYTVFTKELNFNPYHSTVLQFRIVTNLSHFMQLGDAIEYFRKSPLMPMIVQPDVKDYQLVFSNTLTPLVSKNKLDKEQMSAVMKITKVAGKREPKVALVEGPPGTGKTQVLVNIVLQLLHDQVKNRQGEPMKILVCATTESALDEIVLRIYSVLQTLQDKYVKMVRLGEVDQMHPRTRKFSLQEMSERYINQNLKGYWDKETLTSVEYQILTLSNQIKKAKKLALENRLGAILALAFFEKCLEIKKENRMVTKIRREEYKELLTKTKRIFLTGQNLFLCTTSYAKDMDSTFIKKQLIPVCIIDEATLLPEIDIWPLLMFGVRTLVLFGDVHIHSTNYLSSSTLEKMGMGESLFSRIKKNFSGVEKCSITKLICQYRMTREIANFPNSFFYERILKNRVESDLPIVPYKMFNFEKLEDHEEIQASFALNLVLCISKYSNFKKSRPLTVAIIVPYKTSRNAIRNAINKKLAKMAEISIEIDTANNLRNQERDIVVVSCMKQQGVQFLTGQQRLYSSITIARHCLLLYGQFEKLPDENATCMWNALIEDAKNREVFVDIDSNADFSELKKHVIKN